MPTPKKTTLSPAQECRLACQAINRSMKTLRANARRQDIRDALKAMDAPYVFIALTVVDWAKKSR